MKNTSYSFLRSGKKKDANKFSTERKIMFRNKNIMITMYTRALHSAALNSADLGLALMTKIF